MLKELFNLSNEDISKESLLKILKKYSKTISIQDQMIASHLLRQENIFVQDEYRDDFLEVYIKYPLLKLKEIKENKNNYSSKINKDKFLESLNLLKVQLNEEDIKSRADKVYLIHMLISLYSTFILDEPIHPVGTVFPAHLTVTKEDNTYYCPVKKNNEDNPKAVCKFCIAEQTPDV